jgi:hypothetical protein
MKIKNATISYRDVGNCPECGAQFLFDQGAHYGGSFVQTSHFYVVLMKCDNDQCQYTTILHVKLTEDIQSPDLSQVITVQEAAIVFERNAATIRKACVKGWIPARQSGKTWIMLRSDAAARWG